MHQTFSHHLKKTWICLFFSVFLFGLPYCFLGFDITDYGYLLYEGQRAFRHGFVTFLQDQQMPLSNYLNGFFQQFVVGGNLFGMKVLALLIHSFVAVQTFLVVRKTYPSEGSPSDFCLGIVVFFVSIVALSPMMSGIVLVPSYDTLPPLFFVGFILSIVTFLEKRKIAHLLACYVLFFMLILLKITFILAFSIFVAVFAVSFLENRKVPSFQLACLLFCSLLLLAYVLRYHSNSSNDLPASYGFGNLYRKCLYDLKHARLFVASMILFSMLMAFVERFPRYRFATIALCSLFAMVIVKLQLQSLHSNSLFIEKYRLYFSYGITIGLQIFCILLCFKGGFSTWTQKILFFSAILFPCLTDFGSNTGLQKMAFGIWLMPPLLYAALSDKNSHLARSFFKTMILIGMLGAVKLYTTYYRDADNPLKLTSSFRNDKIQHVRTTDERSASYEQLIEASKRYVQKNDSALIYDYNPMLYWLTDTFPINNFSWLHLMSLHEIQTRSENICKTSETTPKMIVKTRASTFDQNWPSTLVDFSDSDVEKTKLLDQVVFENCHPTKVWSNSDFEIWVTSLLQAPLNTKE